MASFIGPRSWLAFHLLNFADNWLYLHPSLWEESEEFQDMSRIMCDLAAVNDTADRCVKDIEDFANAANMVSNVANSHRYRMPQFLKNEMEHDI